MQIVTDSDAIQIIRDERVTRINYADGAVSILPTLFAQGGDGEAVPWAVVHLGRNALINKGSIALYDHPDQSLRIGRYVSGGRRLRFILNAVHNMNTITTWGGLPDHGLHSQPSVRYGDTKIGSDVWIGDEAMFLGGATIGDGCVVGARTLVPPRAVLEPYGVYVGHPARLVRFRFKPDIVQRLLCLQWWKKSPAWIKANESAFAVDLNKDHARALDVLDSLLEN